MKHQIKKTILALMMLLAIVSISSTTYASEITGTLYTSPEENSTSTPNTSTEGNIQTPTGQDSLTGTVTGGIPVAQGVEGQNTYSASVGEENDELNTWLWIAIPSLILIAGLIYVFKRSSHKTIGRPI